MERVALQAPYDGIEEDEYAAGSTALEEESQISHRQGRFRLRLPALRLEEESDLLAGIDVHGERMTGEIHHGTVAALQCVQLPNLPADRGLVRLTVDQEHVSLASGGGVKELVQRTGTGRRIRSIRQMLVFSDADKDAGNTVARYGIARYGGGRQESAFF
jgi:hypothetical protein